MVGKKKGWEGFDVIGRFVASSVEAEVVDCCNAAGRCKVVPTETSSGKVDSPIAIFSCHVSSAGGMGKKILLPRF